MVFSKWHWKISESVYAERSFWDDYTKAFEAALSKCSTDAAPWFVIPANQKWFRDLAISRIVSEYLESLHMEFPKTRSRNRGYPQKVSCR